MVVVWWGVKAAIGGVVVKITVIPKLTPVGIQRVVVTNCCNMDIAMYIVLHLVLLLVVMCDALWGGVWGILWV